LDGRKKGVIVQDVNLDAVVTSEDCPKWAAKANGVYKDALSTGIVLEFHSPLHSGTSAHPIFTVGDESGEVESLLGDEV
jgi:hypothetical protein